MTFNKSPSKSPNGRHIQLVRGNPSCATFYQWLHSELKNAVKTWPPTVTELTPGRQGNLGEFISFRVARHSGLYGKNKGYTVALMGALTPLQDGAPTGLDTTILHLDPNGDESKDCLYIMEVKTTGALELTYANNLVGDYKKLLGKTAVAGSLGQRFNWLLSNLKEVHEFPDDELERVAKLYMPDAKDCQGIRLIPTLVHDRDAGDSEAVAILDSVAARIEKQGWGKQTIDPWSIAIERLTECLVHLSNNGSTMP